LFKIFDVDELKRLSGKINYLHAEIEQLNFSIFLCGYKEFISAGVSVV
jgi:hypothetical protein